MIIISIRIKKDRKQYKNVLSTPTVPYFSVYHPLLSSQLLGKMGSVVLLFTNETSEAQTGYGREQVNTLIVLVLL